MGRASPASFTPPEPCFEVERLQANTLCDQHEMRGQEQRGLAACGSALWRGLVGLAEGVAVQTAAHGPRCGPLPPQAAARAGGTPQCSHKALLCGLAKHGPPPWGLEVLSSRGDLPWCSSFLGTGLSRSPSSAEGSGLPTSARCGHLCDLPYK